MTPVHPMTLAIEWATRGIPAFPVAIKRTEVGALSKRPLTNNGHFDASTDTEVVRDLFVQFADRVRDDEVLAVGLRPGPAGYVVLDADRHGDVDGVEFYASLGLPPTWVVDTGGHGEHHWFRKPAGATYANSIPDAWKATDDDGKRVSRGVDVRADSGWIVAPGVSTPWGDWTPRSEWPGPLAPLPDHVAGILAPAGADGEGTGSVPIGVLTDKNRDLIHHHDLSVLDYVTEHHGAHSPAVRRRGDTGAPYLTVVRPGKAARDGFSATIGYAEPGALYVFSTSWPGLDTYAFLYPLGRDLLGATTEWVAPEDPAPPVDVATGEVLDVASLFDATPTLQHIRTAALARNRSPVATLVGALVLVSTAAGTRWLLPPVVGSPASLNLLAVFAGGTGAAKSSTASLCRELVPKATGLLYDHPPGTGEGLIAVFLGAKPDPDGSLPMVRDKVFVYVDEYAQMAEQSNRPGNTFMSIMRSMAMGEAVGNGNADTAKRRRLARRSYRLGMIVGVQPKMSGDLLSANAMALGTPQRFLWCSIAKPNLDDTPDDPGPLDWDVPSQYLLTEALEGLVIETEPVLIEYPDDIVAYVRAMDRAEDLPDIAAHATLLRLKVAAALAMLHGRWGYFTHWDWAAAGVLVEHSKATMLACQQVAAEHRSQGNRAVGEALAERQVVVERHLATAGEVEAKAAVLAHLRAHPGERFNSKAVGRAMTSRLRPHRDRALEALLADGLVVRHQGQRAGSWLWEAE